MFQATAPRPFLAISVRSFSDAPLAPPSPKSGVLWRALYDPRRQAVLAHRAGGAGRRRGPPPRGTRANRARRPRHRLRSAPRRSSSPPPGSSSCACSRSTPDASGPTTRLCAGCGAGSKAPIPILCASTCVACGASSATTRPTPGGSSARAVSDTGWLARTRNEGAAPRPFAGTGRMQVQTRSTMVRPPRKVRMTAFRMPARTDRLLPRLCPPCRREPRRRIDSERRAMIEVAQSRTRPEGGRYVRSGRRQGFSLGESLPLDYVGSKKHKRWTPGGAAGSICPDFTHVVDGRNFGGVEPEAWRGWSRTVAQRLLTNSVLHGRKRYAAERGIAFCAQETNDGTWHGYPVPWKQVPMDVRCRLIATRQATPVEIRRNLRRQQSIDPNRDRQWALRRDDR